jgi:ubiquinone/menaquinone biosynthesis C-methylase UbiE
MFSDPRNNIEQLMLSDGAVVADFGAGSGFYSIEAAKAVAPRGKVYAVDAQRELLSRLKKEAARQGAHNIEVLAGDLERLGGSRIKENSCDAVIASNILFMISDKKSFLNEAKRILKKDGRLLLVDWAASFSQTGPHADHVIYKDDAVKLALSVGFELDREIHAGSHHYGIIFHKR